MSPLPSDILLDDLDSMFCAVTFRLRRIAEGVDLPTHDAGDRVRASLLECVGALDQLHEMLAHEVEHRHPFEQIVTDAQTALTRAPPEFVAAAVFGLALPGPPIGRLPTCSPESARAA